jgi:hypothetical protein
MASWSFDKGYWHPDNRALLEMVIPEVVMCDSKFGKMIEDNDRPETVRIHSYKNKQLYNIYYNKAKNEFYVK